VARLPVQPNVAGELARREGAVGIVVEADRPKTVVAFDDQRGDVTLSFVSNRASGAEPVTFH
jgi:hypothetical protein